MQKCLSRSLSFYIGHSPLPVLSFLRRCSSAMRTGCDPVPKVFVRCAPDEEKMQAQLSYPPQSTSSKIVRMNRFVSERVSNTLERLAINIQKKSIGKSKQQDLAEHPPNTSVKLLGVDGMEVDGHLHNCHAWSQGCKLLINSFVYVVEMNSPTIVRLELPRVLLSKFIIHPYVQLEFSKHGETEFKWYRIDTEGSETLVSTSSFYIPTDHDCGHKIKLSVQPKSGSRIGEQMDVISSTCVEKGPVHCPFELRHQQVKNHSSTDWFRVVSYNVLAEVYTDTDYSRNTLFKFCPSQFLEYDYRKQLLLADISGYDADIICLQEMDRKHFSAFYKPILDRSGYESSMLMKQYRKLPKDFTAQRACAAEGLPQEADDKRAAHTDDFVTVNEGSAIFFKRSKFRQVSHHNVSIADVVESDPMFSDILSLVKQSPAVYEKLLFRSGSSLQVMVLEPTDRPGTRLLVACTHLYFHPLGSVIRLLQAAVAARLLSWLSSTHSSSGGENSKTAVVFCGDFNSTPDTAVIKFILGDHVASSHPTWTENEMFQLEGTDLSHGLDFSSACGFPDFTNYVPGFQACIDYIFYQNSVLNVKDSISLHERETLSANGGGIPSELFPSDHIPLVCDLEWQFSS